MPARTKKPGARSASTTNRSTFVAVGDTVYAFTRVLEADDDASSEEAGTVTFEHIAFNQDDEPVYSGTRTAEIRKRSN